MWQGHRCDFIIIVLYIDWQIIDVRPHPMFTLDKYCTVKLVNTGLYTEETNTDLFKAFGFYSEIYRSNVCFFSFKYFDIFSTFYCCHYLTLVMLEVDIQSLNHCFPCGIRLRKYLGTFICNICSHILIKLINILDDSILNFAKIMHRFAKQYS